jgi:hypothetical protein
MCRGESRSTSDAEAVLENCRALIDHIIAKLSAEKPFIDVSSLAELLLHLESAASILKEASGLRPQDRGTVGSLVQMRSVSFW